MEPTVFLVQEIPGFAPQIGRLVCMLRYARLTTVAAVRGLTRRQLDHLQDERSNSIGMLLAHIAAVEFAYQVSTFEGRGLTPAELQRWRVALELGAPARSAIRGEVLDHYLAVLDEVRGETLRRLSGKPDSWLDEQGPFWNGLPANNIFRWFHVLEDEVNHRGQIRWLRQRLPAS